MKAYKKPIVNEIALRTGGQLLTTSIPIGETPGDQNLTRGRRPIWDTGMPSEEQK